MLMHTKLLLWSQFFFLQPPITSAAPFITAQLSCKSIFNNYKNICENLFLTGCHVGTLKIGIHNYQTASNSSSATAKTSANI